MLLVVFGGLFVGAVLVPTVPMVTRDVSVSTADVGLDRELPFVLHIILDHQIGIEGVPRQFAGDANPELKHFYREHRFQLYGRAFSRFLLTTESLSRLVNFSATPTPRYFTSSLRSRSVTENMYFRHMNAKGYRIHVFQNDYLNFCRPLSETDRPFECSTQSAVNIRDILDTEISKSDKAYLIAASYTKLSYVVKRILALFDIQLSGTTTHLSGAHMFDLLERELRDARHGQLVFAHVLLPHFPFAYDRACRMNPNPREWADSYALTPRHDLSRREWGAMHYPLYLQQVACAHMRLGKLFDLLKARGIYDQSMIVVHGDHGSRLSGPTDETSQIVNDFSTLFAVKLPGGYASYNSQLFAIDELLRGVVLEGRVPAEMDSATRRFVYVKSSNGDLVKTPVPAFGLR